MAGFDNVKARALKSAAAKLVKRLESLPIIDLAVAAINFCRNSKLPGNRDQMKLSILVSSLLAIMVSQTAFCDEPCEQFLQALRDRGYYDVALDYLEEMETSPLASAEFKSTLPFERAQTLIASTTRVRDLEILEERLGKAEVLLNESEANADSPDLKARSQDYRNNRSPR